MKYPINKIFQTIQFEGYHTGTPAIFIRLQGCPIKCAWCDTKYTWRTIESNRINFKEMFIKTVDNNNWADLTEKNIITIILQNKLTAKHVVITGGEPCLYDLLPLTKILEEQEFKCQIETSGTQNIYCTSETWVTVSPKINMHITFPVLMQALQRSNEIKHIVANSNNIDELDKILRTLKYKKNRIISLQPINQSSMATDLCVKTCIDRNWRLSIQVHKYLDIP